MEQPQTPRALVEVLRDFALLLADDYSADDILNGLSDYTTKLLGVTGVGILLRDKNGELQVATANTEIGQMVEHLEVELREGPCTTSLSTGTQVAEPSLAAAEPRYPRFVPRALEAGARSIHGIPLTVRVEQIGALNIIDSTERVLSAEDLANAQLLGDVAISFVANRRALDSTTELARQLQHALDSRVVIEQAKGKLAERLNLSVNDAFERIRTHARANQLKVHDVAAAVLAGDLDL